MLRSKMATVGVFMALVIVAGCGGQAKPAPAATPAPAPAPAATPAPAPQKEEAAKPASAPAATGTKYAVVADQSLATYTVGEKFANRELPNDAVGSTSSFQGELILDGGLLKPSTVTVDLRTLKSDSSRRDSTLKTRGLETDKYPEAVFTLNGIEGADKIPADGKEVSFKLAGSMKIHGTEKPMVFDTKAKLQGDTFQLTSVVNFKMTDFGITPPSTAGMLTVKEEVKLEVKVTAKKN